VSQDRQIVDAQRQNYNAVRRHSTLGYLTPEESEQLSRKGSSENGRQSQVDER
jgi:transposase InsO family protein